jgi:hypothetical protein
MNLDLDSNYMKLEEKVYREKVAWHMADESCFTEYRSMLSQQLGGIVIPVDALACHNPLCDSLSHCKALDVYASAITRVCIEAAAATFPRTGKRAQWRVPGWTEKVEPARRQSILWHNIWVECGRPKTGNVADIMRRTRAQYHYAVRSVKRDENNIVKQRFAETVLNDGYNRNFWKEVKKLNGKKAVSAGVVDDNCNPQSISQLFADKYQDLYNNVSYNVEELKGIQLSIVEKIAQTGYCADYIIRPDEVIEALCRLKANKNDGGEGLSTNHFKFAGVELSVHLAFLFSSILVHGSMPDDFHKCTAIPIPKSKNLNVTDSNNYRGIALSSIFAKIFDLIVLVRYSDYLDSCELQFGFKRDHSTTMCSMIMKETISNYINAKSTVHCVFLDATKAFDRVEYCKLFKLLEERDMPAHVIRVLLNLYTGHQVRVMWNGIASSSFRVSNGVIQGGILSPVLFCIYLDVLLLALKHAGVGCHLGKWFIGALAYADDLVLLAPTARAMRIMLKICDDFATKYSLKFNASKSKSLTISLYNKRKMSALNTCSFIIGGNVIEDVDKWTHLGHIINNKLTDDDDIIFRRNSMVGQINNFLCNFSKLDLLIKNQLYKVYCTSFYGCELWDLNNSCIEQFCIEWRKGARRVWSLPRHARSDIVYCIADVIPTYDELCRRSMNFVISCQNSKSRLVKFVANYGSKYSCRPMHSFIARNAVFCSLRYGKPITQLYNSRVSLITICNFYLASLNRELKVAAANARELALVRDGCLFVPGIEFSRDFLYGAITEMVT